MAIRAIYTEILPDGRAQFGLSNEDFDKIVHGYGCPNCLEDFSDWGARGMVVPFGACPVCKHVLDVGRDILATPKHWLPDPSDMRSDDA